MLDAGNAKKKGTVPEMKRAQGSIPRGENWPNSFFLSFFSPRFIDNDACVCSVFVNLPPTEFEIPLSQTKEKSAKLSRMSRRVFHTLLAPTFR